MMKGDIMSDQPAGWYPDPSGDQNLLRYWDGAQWSTQTQPKQVITVPNQPRRRNIVAIVGLICGICSSLAVVIIIFLTPLISTASAVGEVISLAAFFIWVIMGLAAIVLGVIGLFRPPRALAVVSLILGLLNLALLGLIFFFLYSFISYNPFP